MDQFAFSENDLDQIREKGISRESIEQQLENFRRGFPPIALVEPATAGNGIIRLSDEEIHAYSDKYRKWQGQLQIVKFIPASGAATRMFKGLFEYLNESGMETLGRKLAADVSEFIDGLEKLALEEDLRESLRKQGKDLTALISDGKMAEIIRTVLQEVGLNYGQLPKALLKFHKYPGESRTSLEEHLVEAAAYGTGKGNWANLHFTVSEEHLEHFRGLLMQQKSFYEKRYGVRYGVDFSLQRSHTDTLAADIDNRPFRGTDGRLVFRPGGHGALLANLNGLEADLIFIKNVDNVCPDRMKPLTSLYKRALAGILLETRDAVFSYLRMLEKGDFSTLSEIEHYLERHLSTRMPEGDRKLEGRAKANLLKRKLDRPIRVCGMVRNEGEPGGGPFWARNRDGSESLQIVESAQIDHTDRKQSSIAGRATHFNPVDLVCATRNRLGEPFDLNDFIDPSTGFISLKSRDGRSLKAQELPGLWNGSMSDWNTLFVEVPIETFNPVKTINDLLRPEHMA